jgi:class 3 adenylate cyclase/tetratricopeptide (TPR) repeat protein
MRCAICGHDNRANRELCSGCGEPLVATVGCNHCGAANRASQRFCGECGHALNGGARADLRSPPASGEVPGELKQVTVLFADVKGSMDLSGSIGVEQWWGIMRRFFSLLADGVERFEGRVDRFTGDGVMAVFGAPNALEDHARRACHAALWLQAEVARYAEELRRERALSFAVRIGLNSGEVVAGTIGEARSAEYTAIGHAAGLAQRMETLAEPGGIYLTESTATLVRGFFILHERGALEVKGVAKPMRVFSLAGDHESRSAFDMSLARGLSRFVGREQEMAALGEALARTREESGQALAVVAEAGVGKTRLCHEFLEGCRREGLRVREARAFAHTRAVPFVPVLELIRDNFDIAQSDDDRVAREKVTARLDELGADMAQTLPLLLNFLGIADSGPSPAHVDPEARQRALFAALSWVVRGRAPEEEGVILIEDLHWIDSASAAFFAHLVDGLAGMRTLVLATYRPDRPPPWMDAPYCSELRLQPLGGDASELLLQELLGSDGSLDGIGALIFAHAEGNPFFIEEIVKALAENGTLDGVRGAYRLMRTIGEVEVPRTVQSVLAARIDRLQEREKRVLQVASVIGRQFSDAVLARVAGVQEDELTSALHGLLHAELIFRRSGSGEYVFKHALAERVAYHSQLADSRALRHAAAAGAIADLHPDRLDELAALIAHHWERGGEGLRAAQWYSRAAGWAGFKDPKEALRQWHKARELADTAAESRERSDLALGARVMLLNLLWRQGVPENEPREDFERETLALYEEASVLARAAEDLPAQAVTVATYGAVRGLAGHLGDMADLGTRALQLADRTGDHGLKLSLLPCAVYGLYALGRYAEVLALLDEASAELPENPADVVGVTLVCPYAWVLGWQAAARASTGALARAFAGFQQALTIARERGDFETESWIQMSVVQAMQLAGRDDAMPHAREAQQIAERTGGAFSLGLAWRYMGIAHLLREEWVEAIEALEQALATWRPRGVGLEAEPHALTMLARAQLGLGDAETAGITAQEAVTLAMARQTRGHEIEARLALAQALRASGGAGAAAPVEGHLRRARSLVLETGARTLQPRVHCELAELARLRGDEATCEQQLQEARRLFEEVGAPNLATRVGLSVSSA